MSFGWVCPEAKLTLLPARRMTEIKFETNCYLECKLSGIRDIGCCLAFCEFIEEGQYSTEEIIQKFDLWNELTQDGRGILERYISKLPKRPPGNHTLDIFHKGHDTLSNLHTYDWRLPSVYNGPCICTKDDNS
jgi:hypothetical protein